MRSWEYSNEEKFEKFYSLFRSSTVAFHAIDVGSNPTQATL